jgi:hypothetical protein
MELYPYHSISGLILGVILQVIAKIRLEFEPFLAYFNTYPGNLQNIVSLLIPDFESGHE